MTVKLGGVDYIPGMYSRKRTSGMQLCENYIRDLKKKVAYKKSRKNRPLICPTISFSRKIGVGALEIADMVGETLKYNVFDYEILEYIANEAKVQEKTVAHFDERYPGKFDEIATFLFGERSFVQNIYSRHLFKGVLAVASLESTIFVGRGTYLILPRERILAVRCICSDQYRIKRLSQIMSVEESEAESRLEQIDREQQAFYKAVYKKNNIGVDEFDIIINLDHINDPKTAAVIVEQAFIGRFGDEITP
jgi:cytidylate kinase-like protein